MQVVDFSFQKIYLRQALRLSLNPSNNPKDFLGTLSPMGTISDAKEIADAVVYLTEARNVTGEVLHVDGGAHTGRW